MGVKPRCLVDLSVEARVGIAIGHMDGGPLRGTGTHQATADGHPHGRQITGHFDIELAARRIMQPDRHPLDPHQLPRNPSDPLEQAVQIEWRRKRTRHIQHGRPAFRGGNGGGRVWKHVDGQCHHRAEPPSQATFASRLCAGFAW